MHGPEIIRKTAATTPEDVNGVLNFLWLELTNRCNLQCLHCYTESGPHTGDGDILTAENYEDLMTEAHESVAGRSSLSGASLSSIRSSSVCCGSAPKSDSISSRFSVI